MFCILAGNKNDSKNDSFIFIRQVSNGIDKLNSYNKNAQLNTQIQNKNICWSILTNQQIVKKDNTTPKKSNVL